MSVTIKDVAKKANVSIATVSRVFNDYSDISDATKNRIKKIAKEMNYVPNLAARTLSSKTQESIACIFNRLDFSTKAPWILEVLSGVYQYTIGADQKFVFYVTSDEIQNEKTYTQFCYEHNITGAVIGGLTMNDPYYHEIKATTIPTVIIDMEADNKFVGTVSVDNKKASEEAVDYLVSLGHREIAMINGKRETYVSLVREQGYRKSLEKNNLMSKKTTIFYTDFEEGAAYEATKLLLREHPEITAIFCVNDLVAVGALQAVKDLRLSVPGDISIMGFDDIPLAAYVNPNLSTVHQNLEQIAFEGAKLLHSIILKEERKSNKLFLPHEIIIRESVGQAPN